MDTQRLTRQIAFILEIDRLKTVLRRTYLLDESRNENSAEHSWHLALMAMVLSEHANAKVDVAHVIRMVLVHDVVEIDAGDTYCYDTAGLENKEEREQAAAARIFGLLPDDQRDEMLALWREFEARETPEARFAAALDRLMPMLHNYETRGRSWQEHGIVSGQVLARNAHIADGSEGLWEYTQAFVADAVEKGWLAPGV
jgi:putative hydrolase of HD superfamily